MRMLGILGGNGVAVDRRRLPADQRGRRLGGVHSASLVAISYDFAGIEALQISGRWTAAGRLLAEGASRLEKAGAEGLFLCTNAMHKVASAIETETTIPLLHIADATAAAIQLEGIGRVGLLGTRFTMQEDFYRGRLARHGLKVLVPNADDAEIVHRVICEELVRGQVRPESRQLSETSSRTSSAGERKGSSPDVPRSSSSSTRKTSRSLTSPPPRSTSYRQLDWILASDDGYEVGQHQIQT